ncbi:MAG: methyltransferase [Oscillospiraceae bacterium]|nr:methyltransferase [Oscillospiraceae bacterium]
METLPNGFTISLGEGCFPLSTDSMVLAHFARLPRNARVLDLGSGCGTLGLLLCAKDSGCAITGMELDEIAHEAALANIRRNGLEHRMESICANLRQVSNYFVPGSFSCIISNPPYFSGGPASRSLSAARREEQCTLADLCSSAAWALKYGGDFFLVHRPERLAEIIARCAENGLEAKRLCLLRHKAGGPITLILLHLRKGAKPGLKIEEQALFDKNGTPTSFYKDVYHIQ